MSDNVTPISQHPRWQPAESESRANELRHRKREELRLLEIERACTKGRKGEADRKQLRWKGNDSVFASIAIHELKEKLPRGGIERVKKEFQKIHRFSISPNDVDLSTGKLKSTGKRDKKNRTQLVRPYLKAAEVIAKVGGLDFDDVVKCKLCVLRNTSLWNTWGQKFSTQNERSLLADEFVEQTTLLIKLMAARIVRDTDLEKLFGRMRLVPGQWDINTETFEGTTGMACLFRTAYCEGYEAWEEAPPLPSVPLVKFWQAGWNIPEGGTLLDNTNGTASELSTVSLSTEIHLYREIRFAIGPTVSAKTIGPLFETRPLFELKITAGAEEFTTALELPDVLLESSTKPFLLQVGETTYRVEKPENLSKLTWEVLWDCTPLSADKKNLESYYISWTPVDAAHTAHWFGRDDVEATSAVYFLARDQTRNDRLGVLGTPARSLRWAIQNNTLKTALISEIEKIKTAFETHETEWREYLQERTATLAAELDADQSPSS